jgi:hypothetical protein
MATRVGLTQITACPEAGTLGSSKAGIADSLSLIVTAKDCKSVEIKTMSWYSP